MSDEWGRWELHLGAIRGVRSFELDGKTGKLRSVVQTEYTWVPGHNSAVCINGSPNDWDIACAGGGGSIRRDHKMDKCSCGFYAFHSRKHDTNRAYTQLWGEADSRTHVCVSGVVEASGRVMVGTKGFRAEHAKIVALAPHGSTLAPLRWPLWPQLALVGGYLLFLAGRIFSGVTGRTDTGVAWWLSIMFGALGLLFMAWWSSDTVKANRLTVDDLDSDRDPVALSGWEWRQRAQLQHLERLRGANRARELLKLAAERYPDAEIFATEAQMLMAYPTEGDAWKTRDGVDADTEKEAA